MLNKISLAACALAGSVVLLSAAQSAMASDIDYSVDRSARIEKVQSVFGRHHNQY